MAKWDDNVARCRREKNTVRGHKGSFQRNAACGMPRGTTSSLGTGPAFPMRPPLGGPGFFRGRLPGGLVARLDAPHRGALGPGDRIRFIDYRGTVRTGKIVMRSSAPDSWVVNTGGRYGTPAVVHEDSVL